MLALAVMKWRDQSEREGNGRWRAKWNESANPYAIVIAL